MALVAANLERIGGGTNGLFILNAVADTAATVTGSGYFNAVTNRLRQGDVILIVGNSAASIDVAIVTSATDAATVTTTAVEGVTAT